MNSMKFFTVMCSKHGTFDIKANEQGECPVVCPMTIQGKVCGLKLSRKFSVPTVVYNAAGFTKRIEK